MRYKTSSIIEMAGYVQSLSAEFKSRMVAHIRKKKMRNAEKVMSELEQISLGEEDLKENLLLIYADRNKDYARFIKVLEEFRLADESIDYLVEADAHSQLQIEISTRILSAQTMANSGKPFNACEALIKLYKKSKKYEMLSQQKDCISKLCRIYYSLDERKYQKWNKKFIKVQQELQAFRSISAYFNSVVESKFCCEFHKTDFEFEFRRKSSLPKLTKVTFMKSFLRACALRKKGDHRNAQRISWELLSLIKGNKLIFSNHYYLFLMQFILENMYYLDKIHVVRKAARRIEVLNGLPIHQTFPLRSLHLYELFRQSKRSDMLMEISVIERDPIHRNYIHIRQLISAARLHALYLKGEFNACLRLINRDLLLRKLPCCRQKADLKILEIICLIEMRSLNTAFNRLDAFGKYVLRSKKSRETEIYSHVNQILKEFLKVGSFNRRCLELAKNIKSIQVPIYSYQPAATFYWMRNKLG